MANEEIVTMEWILNATNKEIIENVELVKKYLKIKEKTYERFKKLYNSIPEKVEEKDKKMKIKKLRYFKAMTETKNDIEKVKEKIGPILAILGEERGARCT